jgi:hypothetical protein
METVKTVSEECGVPSTGLKPGVNEITFEAKLLALALHKKSGSVLGEGQYRNAVASGESPGSQYSRVIDVHRRPDATALRY